MTGGQQLEGRGGSYVGLGRVWREGRKEGKEGGREGKGGEEIEAEVGAREAQRSECVRGVWWWLRGSLSFFLLRSVPLLSLVVPCSRECGGREYWFYRASVSTMRMKLKVNDSVCSQRRRRRRPLLGNRVEDCTGAGFRVTQQM